MRKSIALKIGGRCRMIRLHGLVLVAGFVSLISGCGGDGLDRAIVAGAVSYRGQPVQDGQIRFIPQEGTPGPVTIAPITSGQYRCDRLGGVPVGMHRVEILAFDPNSTSPGGPGQPPRKQLLPAKFHQNSQLIANVEAIGGEAMHDFMLDE